VAGLDERGNIVNPTWVDWEAGGAFVTPPGLWHAHFNESGAPAHLIPTLACRRTCVAWTSAFPTAGDLAQVRGYCGWRHLKSGLGHLFIHRSGSSRGGPVSGAGRMFDESPTRDLLSAAEGSIRFAIDHHQPLGFERTLASLERQIGYRARWLYQAVAPPSTGWLEPVM
jgi:hypothetical protein